MFSHLNDTGFWMFKEYYNASVKQTFQVWTVMECTVGTVGLIGVLIMNAIVGPPPPKPVTQVTMPTAVVATR